MRRARRTILGLAAVCAATAIVPATAGASALTRATDGALVVTAAPGEANRLVLYPGWEDGTITLYESHVGFDATPAPDGCTRDATSVTCPTPPQIRASLGDGDDSVGVSSDMAVPLVVSGGAGDDELDAGTGGSTLDGGPGRDTLHGSAGRDVLVGGDGDDDLSGQADSDRLAGGAGDDVLRPDGYEAPSADVVDGGPGVDRIEQDYTDRGRSGPQPPVRLTLEGGADDGRAGEHDDVHGVEQVELYVGADLVGTDAAETLTLIQVGANSTIDGAGGDDAIHAGDGADRVLGGAGDDTIDAGYGDDTIVPGPGRDSVLADGNGDCGPLWCKYPYGNDTIDARDGEVDRITCGPGTDTVRADATDVVAPDCEHVTRSAGGRHVTLKATAIRLWAALAHGVVVRVAGAKAHGTVKLTARAGGHVVARGRARAGAGGAAKVTVRFTAAGRRALRRATRVRLAIAGAGGSVTVVLRRSVPRAARASVARAKVPAFTARTFRVAVKGTQRTTWTEQRAGDGACQPTLSGHGSEAVSFHSTGVHRMTAKRFGTSYVIFGDPSHVGGDELPARATVTRRGEASATPVPASCGDNGGPDGPTGPAARDCGTKRSAYGVRLEFANERRVGFLLTEGTLLPLGRLFTTCPWVTGPPAFPSLLRQDTKGRPIVARITAKELFDRRTGQWIVVARGTRTTNEAGVKTTTTTTWEVNLKRVRS